MVSKSKSRSSNSKAKLPGDLSPISNKETNLLITNYPAYVLEARAKARQNLAASADKSDEIASPDESDVPVKYLALVSPDDKSAVMDLVAIAPASRTSTQPVVYERKDEKWVPNEQILMDLKSSSPPPVIPLEDKKVLNDVLLQVDDKALAMQSSGFDFAIYWSSTIEPILAAGGLDRNRGNAEALRRYWTRGKGAAKIRWGTPGDWTRCVRQLSKYMGNRAKGYCQLRHKEATGVYTGSRANPGNRKGVRGMAEMFTSGQEFSN